MFAAVQSKIPENEKPNLVLMGDFNVDLAIANNARVKLLRSLCKQFNLTIHETKDGIRGAAKLDYLISGHGVSVDLVKHQTKDIPSDHDVITWRVKFNATKKPEKICILNRKLVPEITEASINDEKLKIRHPF